MKKPIEVYGGVSYKRVSATAYFGINNSLKDNGDTDKHVWLEAGVEYPVGPVTLAATAGTLNSNIADTDYSNGASGPPRMLPVRPSASPTTDTDSDGEKPFGNSPDGRAVFSISKEM